MGSTFTVEYFTCITTTHHVPCTHLPISIGQDREIGQARRTQTLARRPTSVLRRPTSTATATAADAEGQGASPPDRRDGAVDAKGEGA